MDPPADGPAAGRPNIDEAGHSPIGVAVAVTLLTIAAGLVYSIWLMPAITHRHEWWVIRDVWPPMLAARYVSTGALGFMYQAGQAFTGMPLGPIVLAPAAAIGDTLRLTDSSMYRVPHPSLWLLYEPYTVALCGTLLLAGGRLMNDVRRGVSAVARSVWPDGAWTQAALAILVIFPTAIVSGHFESVLALACILAGVRCALAGRWRQAALWCGLAAGFDLWAVVALPVLLAMAPAEQRAAMAVRALVVPVAAAVVVLAIDPANASRALLHPLTYPMSGHALPWIHRSAAPIDWGLQRLMALIPALVVAWLLRGRRDPTVILAAFGLVFLLTPLFGAVTYAYQLCPALAFLFLFDRARGRSGLRTLVVGVPAMLWYLAHPSPVLWWLATVAAGAWLAWPAARTLLTATTQPVGAEPSAHMAHAEVGSIR